VSRKFKCKFFSVQQTKKISNEIGHKTCTKLSDGVELSVSFLRWVLLTFCYTVSGRNFPPNASFINSSRLTCIK